MSRNFDALSLFLSNIDTKFSIIGLSETCLQHSDIQSDIPGYKFIHNHHHNRSGGGVGLYFSADLNYKVRKDINYESVCAASLFIEIVKPKGKNIVGVVYRPPGLNVNEFIVNTDSLISKISSENKKCFIMGDFSLNLLNCHNHKLTNEFLDTLFSNMFFPLITRPTRITSYNATLIDNIFTNDLDNCSFSGLFFTDISDHLPIFCLPITQDQINNVDDSTYVVSRDMHNDAVLKFRDKLRSTNWKLDRYLHIQ